jgi:hypothetical protein
MAFFQKEKIGFKNIFETGRKKYIFRPFSKER